MAIDGVIAFVTLTTVDGEAALELLIMDRPPNGESGQPWGIGGQKTLTILSPTWTPAIGMRLWGGGGGVQIVIGRAGGPWYDRIGYTRLRERPATATEAGGMSAGATGGAVPGGDKGGAT